MKKHTITAIACLVVALAVTVISGISFIQAREVPDPIPGPGVTSVERLSKYFPGIEGTNADTNVYVMEGSQPGGKMLILGGTHGNEPSGYMSAILFVETAVVDSGTVYVIPYTNHSGMTHNDPQEGSPQFFTLTTKSGERTFRYGSRASNPVDQWPDPDIYIHAASGQRLSGSETRNINRAYPGKPDGTLTEQAAYAVTELIRTEGIDLTFDLHEASPEYPVINATVSHEKGIDIASMGVMDLQFSGIEMTLEPSPVNLHGLTHRELGDYTDTIPLLMETANASQGRLRGATNVEQVLTGKDKYYTYAATLGVLYVPYDDNGHPIEERCGRHIQGIYEYSKNYSLLYADNPISFHAVPNYQELFLDSDGSDLGGARLGSYLN